MVFYAPLVYYIPFWYLLQEGPSYRLRAPGILQCPFRAVSPPLHHPGCRFADPASGVGGGEGRCGKRHCGMLGSARAAAKPLPRRPWCASYACRAALGCIRIWFPQQEGPSYRLRAPGILQCPFRAVSPPLHHPGCRFADPASGVGGGEGRCGKGHCGMLGSARAAAKPLPRQPWYASYHEETAATCAALRCRRGRRVPLRRRLAPRPRGGCGAAVAVDPLLDPDDRVGVRISLPYQASTSARSAWICWASTSPRAPTTPRSGRT